MKIKILDSYLIYPSDLRPATEGSAAIDLRAAIDFPMTLYPQDTAIIPTGIACALPANQALILAPRSGMGVKGLILANTIGLIDSDYRGEIKVALWYRKMEGPAITVQPKDRIAQAFIVNIGSPHEVEIVDSLDDTERGAGGFGSTGHE